VLKKEFMTETTSVPQPQPQVNVPEPYIDKAEVARRLEVQVRTIDNWMRRKMIPYYKIGRAVKFKWSDVEAYLAANFRIARRSGAN
jgi:excisionase family DNA binding protein